MQYPLSLFQLSSDVLFPNLFPEVFVKSWPSIAASPLAVIDYRNLLALTGRHSSSFSVEHSAVTSLESSFA
jgi:hypothetical protein